MDNDTRELIEAKLDVFVEKLQNINNNINKLDATMQERITAVTDIISAKSIAQQEAIRKAETASEKRFEAVNDFKEQLGNSISQFATREALNAGIKERATATDVVGARLGLLEGRVSNLEGRIVVYIGAAGGLVTCLAALFSYFGHILK